MDYKVIDSLTEDNIISIYDDLLNNTPEDVEYFAFCACIARKYQSSCPWYSYNLSTNQSGTWGCILIYSPTDDTTCRSSCGAGCMHGNSYLPGSWSTASNNDACRR